MSGRFRRSTRRGVTLVELLVIVMIISLLLGSALPILKSGTEQRRTREATRQISGYFSMAKARAAQLGRPVGVWIQRQEKTSLDPTSNYAYRPQALELYLAETPRPFGGGFSWSRVRLIPNTRTGRAQLDFVYDPGLVPQWLANSQGYDANDDAFTKATLNNALVPLARAGGVQVAVRFNYTGPWYTTDVVLQRDTVTLEINDPINLCSPPLVSGCPKYDNNRVAYQILLPPVRSYESPLELPAGVCIDLNVSGYEYFSHIADPIKGRELAVPANSAVILMFLPGGGLDKVYGIPATLGQPLDRVYLMVGSTDKVVLQTDPSQVDPQRWMESNLVDPESYWITITTLTGKVSTTENSPQASDTPVGLNILLNTSRRFARMATDVGGQ